MGKSTQFSPINAREAPAECPPSPVCLPPPALGYSYSMYESFSQDIIDKYDAFILDQFGVMHNGVNAMDGAHELVNFLAKDQNKKLIVLSNTSAPAAGALVKLTTKLGFDKQDFAGMVTSGEEAARYIRNTYDKTTKCLFFTWDATIPNSPRLTAPPSAFLEKCGLSLAQSVKEADLLLLHGTEVWFRGDDEEQVSFGNFINTGNLEETIDPILQECLERKIPCVCANPDVVVQNPNGGVAYCPGLIGQRYQSMGGNVKIFGKPQPEHFEACLRTLGLPADRVCHVGDSLHHDIAGANMAGVDSIFVTSGIHKKDLGTSFGEVAEREKIDQLIEEVGGIVPTHVIPAFRL